MRQRACCCCCFSADCCLLSALPSPNSSSSSALLPGDSSKTPRRAGAQRSSFIWVLRSLSLPSLCAAPTCQPHASKDGASPGWESHSLPGRPSSSSSSAGSTKVPCLSSHRSIAPHAWKFTRSREAGKWMLTSAFVRGTDYFQTWFWAQVFMGTQQNALAAPPQQHRVLSMSPQTQMLTWKLWKRNPANASTPPVPSLWRGGGVCLSI